MDPQIRQFFYPNGRLQSEMTVVNGKAHGLTRDYHPNGQLSAEMPVENGLQHGTIRHWATDGRFLGEYQMEHGTGVAKLWYDNGALHAEVPMSNRLLTGRQKSWDEKGEAAITFYWIRGKKVSRKRYLEACANDRELPQYPDEKPHSAKSASRSRAPCRTRTISTPEPLVNSR